MILVGLVSSTVFGFLDNAGLFFGSNQLDDVFQTFPYADDANCFAGQGNTQSDFLGAFLGTFCGLIINDIAEQDSSPIWCQAIGMVAGCLLGILIPKLIMGSESDNHGINRATAMNNLIGSLSQEDIKEMLVNQETSEVDFLATKVFKKIDVDNSGQHDTAEIKQYLMTAGVSADEIEPLIERFMAGDTNKDNKIDYNEFKVIFLGIVQSELQDKKGFESLK